jgi:nicotinamide phosphoribosyltransferase
MKKRNIVEEFVVISPLITDSYKVGHHGMYPKDTQNVYSYFESRKGAKYDETVFFGLQIILKEYMTGVVVTKEDIDEGEAFAKEHFMGNNFFNRAMWDKIVDVHGGKLPLRIKAVPEGTPVTISNVLMTVEATDEDCAPLVNFFETLLTHVWYTSNVATISRNIKKRLKKGFDKTVPDDLGWLIDYMLHDFGFRGAACLEQAARGGAGHLVNFKGTDTIPAIIAARHYYNTDEMVGHSVAATEHSVMTAEGPEGEFDVVRRLIKEYPDGILSVVSDSYDIENAIKMYGTELKEDILGRNWENGAKFVIRPDSPRFEGDTPAEQIVWIAQELEKYFGAEKNDKGYKMLHPAVGIIYGDGLSEEEITDAIDFLEFHGFAASTCVFGMGGGLLQKHNRDTQRNAFKCSAQKRDGEWRDIFKDPKDKSKASKRGRLGLIKMADGRYITSTEYNTSEEGNGGVKLDELVTVFENGELTKEYTWDEVRENAEVK